MSTCCDNIVTPKMIRAGQVAVGDKIRLEDFAAAAAASAQTAAAVPAAAEASMPAAMPASASAAAPTVPAAGTAGGGATAAGARNQRWSEFGTLPYAQMTPYMNNISLGGSADEPSIITPRAPMTPCGYDEEIAYDSIQTLNGFLRTQIGRYMRIEQLVGSNTIQDRYGFLVGVGSNYVLLQEITTGNIMMLDIFSIKLTYVYFSQPVIPEL